jgi:CBS domain-containing protein/anti-sigma regulatory factor (Ser/Thr protein kinase)
MMRERLSAEGTPLVTKSQELVYELRIGEIMTPDPVTVEPGCLMSELKEILRMKRISGVPVLEAGQLAGIISIEDLVVALSRGEISARVGDKMTRRVEVVYADESVVKAVNKFGRYGFGRLPVVDRDGRLVGIVTQGDIVRGLLRRLEVQWHEEEIHRYRASHIFEDIESDQTGLVLRYKVAAKDFVRGGEASSKLKRALSRLGARPAVVRRVAVAAYEAETNLIIHADAGGNLIAEIQPDRIRVVALDTGPGIADVEKAMQPGYSTAPDWIRELGFGAGMGLTNIQSCADELKLESRLGVGTRLEAIFRLPDSRKEGA